MQVCQRLTEQRVPTDMWITQSSLCHQAKKKAPKKTIFHRFFAIFSRFFGLFPYIWPLAGPNIAEKGWPLLGKAWERVWEEIANFEMLVSGAPGARNQHLGRMDGGLNFQAVIKSAASAASLDLQGSPQAPPSACRRLDHGLKG